MELSERSVQVKSSVQLEEDFPSYSPDDIVFFFGDVVRPVGLTLNHNDSTEFYVLFLPAASMQDSFNLGGTLSCVRAHMQLGLQRPQASIFQIISTLLQDKTLEEGEEYEYIPIKPLDSRGSGKHLTPKKGEEPAATNALSDWLKQMPTQELQQIMSALQQEIKSRQNASLGAAHEVSVFLQTLLKEGALRANILKLSAFSGEMIKGEASFEQCSYEIQILRKSYCDSALREGIQCSLIGAPTDAVCNMGPNVPLDMILKKFTIFYGNVNSLDLLMSDFSRADQGENETIPSFTTRIGGLLSQIRDRFPSQLPHQEK